MPDPAAPAPTPDEPPVPTLPDCPPDAPLSWRLAMIAGHVGGVAKSGRNAHFGYTYQRAEDVAGAVAPVAAHYGVAILPLIRRDEITFEVTGQTRAGADIRLYRVPLDLAVCCPTGERVIEWLAYSTDDGDKGIAKAVTSGLKSYLRAQFLIPVPGDDTDSDAGSALAAEAGATGDTRPGRAPTGEVPTLPAGASVTGSVELSPDGTQVGITFKADPREAFDAMRDAVKVSLGARWNKDGKLWVVPAGDAETVVSFARALGLEVRGELVERFPGSPPPPDLPIADIPFDPPPGPSGDPGDDIPF